jgi:predicted ATPase
MAIAEQVGQHCWDPEAHRVCANTLHMLDPTNTSAVEQAFTTAIAIAQQQNARSFELRAALDLARLYNSTSRSGDARDVLACALEGFSPTPEFPEIAEAQALVKTLLS